MIWNIISKNGNRLNRKANNWNFDFFFLLSRIAAVFASVYDEVHEHFDYKPTGGPRHKCIVNTAAMWIKSWPGSTFPQHNSTRWYPLWMTCQQTRVVLYIVTDIKVSPMCWCQDNRLIYSSLLYVWDLLKINTYRQPSRGWPKVFPFYHFLVSRK